jgi:hypothetical protein
MRWGPLGFPASINSASWNIHIFFWWSVIIFSVIMLTPVFIIGLLFGLITETHAQDNKLLVDLGYAKYNGFVGEKGMNQWFGIRYAAPPTGNNRFREPQDPAVNPDVQQANKVSCG